MTPILYAPNATTFDGKGIGRLSDVLRLVVTEELNGEFELVMTYPMDGILYDQIGVKSIIAAQPAPGAKPQPFEVYDMTRPLNGIVTIYGHHLHYRLSFIPVGPFTASDLAGALSGLKQNAAEECPFSFWTNKTVTAAYTQTVPSSIQSRLQGEEGSILQTYRGQFEYDEWQVKLLAQRGEDNGVEIRYGKNLLTLAQEENIRNTITGVYPFWAGLDGDEEAYVELPEKVLHSENAALFPYMRTVPLDLSSEWSEEKPTAAQLRNRAERYMSDNDIGVPEINLKLSFINLADTEDYKDIAPLEAVNLGDVVRVSFDKLGVSNRAQVTKTVYNALLERYDSIQIGNVRANIASVIVQQSIDTQRVAENASKALASFNGSLDQLAVFNRLTNNGEMQGLYMEEGQLYMNASYVRSGVIDADEVSIINLVVSLLRSYANGGITMLESQAGYLDIRRYDEQNGRWEQRLGIFRDTQADAGIIRLSSGDVDYQGNPYTDAASESRRLLMNPERILLGIPKNNSWKDATGEFYAKQATLYGGITIGSENDGKASVGVWSSDGTVEQKDLAYIDLKARDGSLISVLGSDTGKKAFGAKMLRNTAFSSVSVDVTGLQALVVYGKPSGGSGLWSVVIPTNFTGDFQISDATNTVTITYARTSGSYTGTLTRSARTSTSGTLNYVYGIY